MATSSATRPLDNVGRLKKIPIGISHLVSAASSTTSTNAAANGTAASTSTATSALYTAQVSAAAAVPASELKPTPIATKAAGVVAHAPALPGWQSVLQGLTHNIPFFLRTPAEAIIGQDCYTTLIYDADLTSTRCIRLSISKGLGLGIVVFGSIMKVPQILKIIHGRSARGISLSMYVLEVLAYTISLAYAVRKRIPFSTYGENASLTVQNMIITLLIIAYTPLSAELTQQARQRRVAVAAALMAALSVFLFSPAFCPVGLLSFLQALTIPISLISKMPQMVELHTRKAPGQLSAIVVFAQLAGTMARVFTTLTETNDALLFWGFALATVFNAVIFVQLLMYWHGNDRATVIGLDGRPQKLD